MRLIRVFPRYAQGDEVIAEILMPALQPQRRGRNRCKNR